MSVSWPSSLIPEIAERRCIFVLGAGVSASSKSRDGDFSPPSWHKLLTDLAELVDAGSKELVTELIAAQRLLDAAEVATSSINPADFSAFLRKCFSEPGYQPSELHEVIHSIDPKIVITTNYDEIYDNYCRNGSGADGFTVCRYYEDHLLNDIRSTIRVIVKAHGCITDPQKTVLSKTQYYRSRRDFQSFFSVLDSLLMVNTVLFIGCSMTDPDFLLMLENANIKCSSAHTHYALVESGQPQELIRAMREIHNVTCLEYDKGQHEQCLGSLVGLNENVQKWRETHT